MKKEKGDLLQKAKDGQFDVIVHGCNCFHAMGSGIARQIAAVFPEAEEADNASEYGSRDKLGNYTYAELNINGNPLWVINAYTQYRWSGVVDVFEYEAFDTFLNRLCGFLNRVKPEDRPIRVGFPKIGCGLARGDEKRILSNIEKFAKDVSPWAEVTLVEY